MGVRRERPVRSQGEAAPSRCRSPSQHDPPRNPSGPDVCQNFPRSSLDIPWAIEPNHRRHSDDALIQLVAAVLITPNVAPQLIMFSAEELHQPCKILTSELRRISICQPNSFVRKYWLSYEQATRLSTVFEDGGALGKHSLGTVPYWRLARIRATRSRITPTSLCSG